MKPQTSISVRPGNSGRCSGSMLAWSCWQEAERMKPDIAGLKKVEELKAEAEKQFPEYF